MRASEVIGGLAVVGVVALVGFAIADDADSGTITTPTAPTILAPLESTTTTTAGSDEASTTEASESTSATTEPPPTSAETTTSVAPTTDPPQTTTTIGLLPDDQRPTIRVRVLNGGGPAGAATFVTEVLRAEGFDPGGPADAAVGVDSTTVLYAPGQDVLAATVNDAVGALPEFIREADPQDPNWVQFAQDFDVLVLIGPDPS